MAGALARYPNHCALAEARQQVGAEDWDKARATLDRLATVEDPVFGLQVPTSCPEVPSEILIPKNTWADKAAYDEKARRVATLFRDNFKKYESGVSAEVRAAGPRL